MNPATSDAKTRILDAALDLFHRQGVNATGLDQILSASGTGKGQFYHYYASKEDLVLQVLRHFHARIVSGEIPLKRDLRTWDDLEEWFGFFLRAQADMGCERSCPIGTIASELVEESGPLRDEARTIFAHAREPLAALFRTLIERGEMKSGTDPAALADFCFVIMQGGMLLGKIERSTDPFRHAVEHAMAHVRSLRV